MWRPCGYHFPCVVHGPSFNGLWSLLVKMGWGFSVVFSFLHWLLLATAAGGSPWRKIGHADREGPLGWRLAIWRFGKFWLIIPEDFGFFASFLVAFGCTFRMSLLDCCPPVAPPGRGLHDRSGVSSSPWAQTGDTERVGLTGRF